MNNNNNDIFDLYYKQLLNDINNLKIKMLNTDNNFKKLYKEIHEENKKDYNKLKNNLIKMGYVFK